MKTVLAILAIGLFVGSAQALTNEQHLAQSATAISTACADGWVKFCPLTDMKGFGKIEFTVALKKAYAESEATVRNLSESEFFSIMPKLQSLENILVITSNLYIRHARSIIAEASQSAAALEGVLNK